MSYTECYFIKLNKDINLWKYFDQVCARPRTLLLINSVVNTCNSVVGLVVVHITD